MYKTAYKTIYKLLYIKKGLNINKESNMLHKKPLFPTKKKNTTKAAGFCMQKK